MEIRGVLVHSGKAVNVTLAKGYITKIEEIKKSKDLPYISPGFFDIQVNGYNGSDYRLVDLSETHISNIAKSLARSGTTRYMPTFTTMPHDRLLRNLKITREALKNSPILKAGIPGFHLEGPYISSEDGPRGAHNKAYISEPDFDQFLEWQEAAGGLIKYITLAPERKDAINFITKVAKTGVKVAIGHTGCSPELIHEAIKAGATLSTHLGNGSYTSVPRLKNYIWEQLAADELYAGVISDGFHLPESVVRVFDRVKGPDKIILVSDVSQIGGYPPGIYKRESLEVEVFEDGHLGVLGTSILAGAAHLLDWDIVRFMEFTKTSLPDTIRLCTETPTKYFDLPADSYGDIRTGIAANLTTFTLNEGDMRLQIQKTILTDKILYDVNG